MHITVDNPIVCENIRAFVALLRKAEAQREKGAPLLEKSYHAFLNRSTGKLVFVDRYTDIAEYDPKKWKELFVDYAYDCFSESFYATACENANVKEAFSLIDLTTIAVKTVKETIELLNALSLRVKGASSDSATKIQALCKLQVDVELGQKNLLVAAWHSVDRVGAEKLLKNEPVGTFLFRQDPFAKMLSDQLSRELKKDIRCITLTFVSARQTVSDITLIHLDHQWRCYDDALFCEMQGYFELSDLLKSRFASCLKQPLYHTFSQEHNSLTQEKRAG